MNQMTKRLQAIEAALQKQSNEVGYKLAFREEGETDEQAKARAGIADWTGPVIYISFPYRQLPQYQSTEGMQ